MILPFIGVLVTSWNYVRGNFFQMLINVLNWFKIQLGRHWSKCMMFFFKHNIMEITEKEQIFLLSNWSQYFFYFVIFVHFKTTFHCLDTPYQLQQKNETCGFLRQFLADFTDCCQFDRRVWCSGWTGHPVELPATFLWKVNSLFSWKFIFIILFLDFFCAVSFVILFYHSS